MEEEEKAAYLFEKLSIQRYSEISGFYIDVEETKEHCLILINEVLEITPSYEYWERVKEIITKIQP